MVPETIMLIRTIVTSAFVSTWILLGILSLWLFYLQDDVAVKKRWWPRFAVLVGVLFVGFSSTLMFLEAPTNDVLMILPLIIPFTTLISYLNIIMVKFCNKCGRLVYNYNWFGTMKFCAKCGAELDARPDPPEGGWD